MDFTEYVLHLRPWVYYVSKVFFCWFTYGVLYLGMTKDRRLNIKELKEATSGLPDDMLVGLFDSTVDDFYDGSYAVDKGCFAKVE